MAKKKEVFTLEKSAERATRWIGSTSSLIFHTIVFAVSFTLPFFGAPFATVLLVLTTIVSLEAIYLSIFIQMSVNKNTSDIEEIQEDVEDIQEDIDEIAEDVEDIQEDIEDIEEDSDADVKAERKEAQLLSSIQKTLADLQKEIEEIKKP